MSTIRVPTALRSYTDGRLEIQTSASTVGAALEELARQYPGLAPHLFGEGGKLRSYVNLFVNDQDVRTLSGERTPLSEEDRLMILPSVAGGSSMAVNLKAVDHSALKTSMAVRLGILLGTFVAAQAWPVALLAALMLIGTARGKPEFTFIYRALRKANLINPEIISDNPEPHRFSLGVGGAFLAAGALAFSTGATLLGWALTWIVIGLVALNLFGGFCLGCAVYYWLTRVGVPGFSKAPPPGVFPGRRPG